MFSARQRAESRTEKVRPHENRGDTLPKRQVQKPNREKPPAGPDGSHKTVLFDSYLLHPQISKRGRRFGTEDLTPDAETAGATRRRWR